MHSKPLFLSQDNFVTTITIFQKFFRTPGTSFSPLILINQYRSSSSLSSPHCPHTYIIHYTECAVPVSAGIRPVERRRQHLTIYYRYLFHGLDYMHINVVGMVAAGGGGDGRSIYTRIINKEFGDRKLSSNLRQILVMLHKDRGLLK